MTSTAPRSQRDTTAPDGRDAARHPALVRIHPTTGDRVVDRLLRHRILEPDRVDAWKTSWDQARASGAREPFWRFVARQDGVDVRSVQRTAADAYGFPTVRISLVGTLALADLLRTRWPDGAWSRLVALSALPVSVAGATGDGRLVIASSEVADPALPHVVDELVSGPYALAFAEDADLAECTAEIRRHLPGLLPEVLVRLGSAAQPAESAVRRAA